MKIGNRDVMCWGFNDDGGCVAVCNELGIQRIAKKNSQYRWRDNTLCIGWGRSFWPEQYLNGNAKLRKLIDQSFLNKPSAVGRSVNKLCSFDHFKARGVRTPEWTDWKPGAEMMRRDHPKASIVCRITVTGYDGAGIIMCEPGERLPDAELYVQYIPKDAEYRIHVFRGTIIDRCLKYYPPGNRSKDERIGTTSNGILFRRNGIYVPKDADVQAIAAVDALGLDFAGVDVITVGEKAYVLETNTAPEMLPVITKKFADEVRRICHE